MQQKLADSTNHSIYFIFKKSVCKLCHKTFSTNRRLKVHIGRSSSQIQVQDPGSVPKRFLRTPKEVLNDP